MLATNKWLRVSGRDEWEVALRIQRFREALGRRRGALVDIQWVASGASTMVTAAVLYRVPLERAAALL